MNNVFSIVTVQYCIIRIFFKCVAQIHFSHVLCVALMF